MNDQVVTEITRRAMATQFGVALPGENPVQIEAAIDALQELERIEAALSVYRPGSDISRINQLAGIEPVRVADAVIEVLQRAVEICHLTAGAFDVTAGPLVNCWGFSRRRGKKPTDEQIAAALNLLGSDQIQIDPTNRTVFLPRPGMAINLGGIGKGFALDRVAAQLRANGIDAFLIHGGRSSVLARGSDSPEQEQGWKVAIEHPLRPGQRLAEIRLRDAALATSGSGKQFFHHRGQRMGHVLDPRTGRPAGDLLAITVVTPLARDADALSTACFVEGLVATQQHLKSPPAGAASPPSTRSSNNGQRRGHTTTPAWPIAAIAVQQGRRAGEVKLLTLGDSAALACTPPKDTPAG